MPKVEPGDRIEVTGILPNDPAPMPVGSQGNVRSVNQYSLGRERKGQQISVDWDNRSRTLMLLDTDPFKVIGPAKHIFYTCEYCDAWDRSDESHGNVEYMEHLLEHHLERAADADTIN